MCIILYYIKEWVVWGGNCIRRYTKKKKKAAEPTSNNHSVANIMANKSKEEENYLNLQESLLLSESFATISVDTTIVET